MDEPIRATFSTVSGSPSVGTAPPYERAGFYLITAPLHLDSYVFTEVLPQLEELRNGLRQSVTSSSEMVDLQASQTEVVLTEWDLEPPPPCSVPLGAFIDLLRRWREHVAAVRGTDRAPP